MGRVFASPSLTTTGHEVHPPTERSETAYLGADESALANLCLLHRSLAGRLALRGLLGEKEADGKNWLSWRTFIGRLLPKRHPPVDL
jgi:hypothetical protein